MSRYAYEPERTPMEVGLARERKRHPLECCECGGAIQGGTAFYRFGGEIYCRRCTLLYHEDFVPCEDVAPYEDEL